MARILTRKTWDSVGDAFVSSGVSLGCHMDPGVDLGYMLHLASDSK